MNNKLKVLRRTANNNNQEECEPNARQFYVNTGHIRQRQALYNGCDTHVDGLYGINVATFNTCDDPSSPRGSPSAGIHSLARFHPPCSDIRLCKPACLPDCPPEAPGYPLDPSYHLLSCCNLQEDGEPAESCIKYPSPSPDLHSSIRPSSKPASSLKSSYKRTPSPVKEPTISSHKPSTVKQPTVSSHKSSAKPSTVKQPTTVSSYKPPPSPFRPAPRTPSPAYYPTPTASSIEGNGNKLSSKASSVEDNANRAPTSSRVSSKTSKTEATEETEGTEPETEPESEEVDKEEFLPFSAEPKQSGNEVEIVEACPESCFTGKVSVCMVSLISSSRFTMGCQGGSCDRKRSRSNSGSCDRKQSHISVKVTAKDTDAAYAVSTPREKFLSNCCKKYKHPKVRSLFDYNEEVKTTYVPKQYYINTGHMRQRLSMKFPCGGNMPNIHGIVQCQPERQPLSTCDPPVEIYVPSMHTVISKTQAPCVLDLCSLKHLEAPCCVQQCDADIDELAYCCDDPDPCCDPCGDNPCCCNPCSPCCPKTPCTPSHCNAGCCQPLCCPPTCFSKNNSKSPSVCSVPRAKTPPRPRSLTPPPRQRTKPRPAPRSPSIHTRKSSVYSNKSQSACQSYSDECLSVDIVNETPECKAICKLRLASLAVLYLVTFIGLLIIMCLNCFGSVFVICGNVLLLYLIAYDFFTSRDAVHQLEDHDADAILRLRSGNTALLSNLKEIGLSKCSICPCREAEETVNHVLNECRLYAACRNCTWPCGGDVYSKLYGKAEQLEKTVRFFEHIGLRIRLDDRTLEECCM